MLSMQGLNNDQKDLQLIPCHRWASTPAARNSPSPSPAGRSSRGRPDDFLSSSGTQEFAPGDTCGPAPSSPPSAPQCSPDLLDAFGAASGRRYHRNLRRGASAARPRPRCSHSAFRAPRRAAAAAPSAAPAPGLRCSVPTLLQQSAEA